MAMVAMQIMMMEPVHKNNNNNKTKISAPDRRRGPDFCPPYPFLVTEPKIEDRLGTIYVYIHCLLYCMMALETHFLSP